MVNESSRLLKSIQLKVKSICYKNMFWVSKSYHSAVFIFVVVVLFDTQDQNNTMKLRKSKYILS